jgi:hypothetical protein
MYPSPERREVFVSLRSLGLSKDPKDPQRQPYCFPDVSTGFPVHTIIIGFKLLALPFPNVPVINVQAGGVGPMHNLADGVPVINIHVTLTFGNFYLDIKRGRRESTHTPQFGTSGTATHPAWQQHSVKCWAAVCR